jgi:hypothetical protein
MDHDGNLLRDVDRVGDDENLAKKAKRRYHSVPDRVKS